MKKTIYAAAGAMVTVAVLILTAAIPSQTDFDSTYFKTNPLPISVLGQLTNWHKLSTNALSSVTASTQLTITHAGTVTLSFTPRQTEAMLNLTGAVTFATSNLGASNSFVIFGRNVQATNCAATFPAWHWMGGAPATITANKEFIISLSSRGTVDTNVWAAYSEAQ